MVKNSVRFSNAAKSARSEMITGTSEISASRIVGSIEKEPRVSVPKSRGCCLFFDQLVTSPSRRSILRGTVLLGLEHLDRVRRILLVLVRVRRGRCKPLKHVRTFLQLLLVIVDEPCINKAQTKTHQAVQIVRGRFKYLSIFGNRVVHVRTDTIHIGKDNLRTF